MHKISILAHGFIKRELPIDSVFYTITFIVIIRTLFELLLGRLQSFKMNPDFYGNLVGYMHFYLSWICIFFTVAVIVTPFLRLRLIEGIRLTLLCFPIIISVPFVDFVATGGVGGVIQYSGDIGNFFFYYVNCLNPFAPVEIITPGVRLEIFLVVAGSFLGSRFIFRMGFLRSIFFSLALYTMIFFYGYLPPLYTCVGLDFKSVSLSVTGMLRSQKFLSIYIAPSIIVISALVYLSARERRGTLTTVVSCLYPSRLSFYLFLLIFGFLVTAHQHNLYPQILNTDDLVKLLLSIISIGLLFVWSKIINDLYDIDIDRISNRERPLAGGGISEEGARAIANVIIIVSLAFAISSERSFIFYWLFIWSMSSVYSRFPLRLRRFYPVGHMILSLIGVSAFLSGSALVISYKAYEAMQGKEILLHILLTFFFLSHIKDFKDREGDKVGRVYNILNYLKFPKILGVVSLVGFLCSLCAILYTLSLLNGLAVAGILLFLAGGLYFIITIKDTKKVDRLLPACFILLIYVSGVSLYLITVR